MALSMQEFERRRTLLRIVMEGTEIHIASSTDEIANFILMKIKRRVDGTGSCSLALSGGTTPQAIYEYWTAHQSAFHQWNMVRLFWGDERCVPPNHVESNYRTAYDSLLSHVPVPEDHIFRMRGEEHPDSEAKRYRDVLLQNLPQEHGIPVFDLILLGIGEDGHTASIFPNQKDLFETNDLCAAVFHPETKQQRITITGRVINAARCVVIVATGKRKTTIVREILVGAKNYPAAHVRPIHGHLIWLLDRDAAGGRSENECFV